jgi:hypothetical protein
MERNTSLVEMLKGSEVYLCGMLCSHGVKYERYCNIM